MAYNGTERSYSRVQIIDGEVRKSGTLPNLMEGWITPIEKFVWAGAGPIRANFRPFLDQWRLSNCLTPEYASVHKANDTVHGRDAAVVDVRHPVQAKWFLRIWIDRKRGLPVRQESHRVDEDGSESKPPSFEEPTKLQQLPNGGWLAVEGAHTLIALREGRLLSAHAPWTVDVNSISIEKKDIPDSLFDIQFPPGARVVNEIAGGRPAGTQSK